MSWFIYLQINLEQLLGLCFNQKQFRADEFANVEDGVNGTGNVTAAKLGLNS